MIKIKTGDYDVMASGIVHLLAEKESTLSVEDLSMKITFDNKGKEPAIKGEQEDAKNIKITLSNFNNSLGQGNTQLIEIGEKDGRKLFLAFRVFFLKGADTKTFEYTLYLKHA